MKANEIQIGDWVEERHDGKRRFSQVDGEKLLLMMQWNSPIEPIPITVEMLEKNGFVQIEDGVINDLPEGIWQNDNALCGLDYNDRGLFYTFSNNPEEDNLINQIYGIIYVHTLQHALRLCGLTYLADNFKV